MGDYRTHGGRVTQRETETNGGAVIEDVDDVGVHGEFGEEGGCCGGESIEGVGVVAGDGHGGEAEAWEVWSEDVVFGCQDGDQMAELMGGGWVAVEEKYRGVCTVSCFTVEEIEAVDCDIAYFWSESARHVVGGFLKIFGRVSEYGKQKQERKGMQNEHLWQLLESGTKRIDFLGRLC